MTKHPKRILLANTFGGLGYLFCLLLWGWTGILYLPMLFENEHLEKLLIPSASEPVPPPTIQAEASPLMMIFAVAVTIIVLIVTVIVLLRAPVSIAKTGKSVTTKAAGSALPLITKGKVVTQAKQKKLTASLIKLTKLLLVIIPVILASLGYFADIELPFEAAMLASSLLAIIAMLSFSIQYIAARLMNIDSKLLV